MSTALPENCVTIATLSSQVEAVQTGIDDLADDTSSDVGQLGEQANGVIDSVRNWATACANGNVEPVQHLEHFLRTGEKGLALVQTFASLGDLGAGTAFAAVRTLLQLACKIVNVVTGAGQPVERNAILTQMDIDKVDECLHLLRNGNAGLRFDAVAVGGFVKTSNVEQFNLYVVVGHLGVSTPRYTEAIRESCIRLQKLVRRTKDRTPHNAVQLFQELVWFSFRARYFYAQLLKLNDSMEPAMKQERAAGWTLLKNMMRILLLRPSPLLGQIMMNDSARGLFERTLLALHQDATNEIPPRLQIIHLREKKQQAGEEGRRLDFKSGGEVTKSSKSLLLFHPTKLTAGGLFMVLPVPAPDDMGVRGTWKWMAGTDTKRHVRLLHCHTGCLMTVNRRAFLARNDVILQYANASNEGTKATDALSNVVIMTRVAHDTWTLSFLGRPNAVLEKERGVKNAALPPRKLRIRDAPGDQLQFIATDVPTTIH